MAAPTEELGAATGCSDCAEVPACASQSDEQPEQPAEGAPPKAGVKLNRRQRRKLVRAPWGRSIRRSHPPSTFRVAGHQRRCMHTRLHRPAGFEAAVDRARDPPGAPALCAGRNVRRPTAAGAQQRWQRRAWRERAATVCAGERRGPAGSRNGLVSHSLRTRAPTAPSLVPIMPGSCARPAANALCSAHQQRIAAAQGLPGITAVAPLGRQQLPRR